MNYKKHPVAEILNRGKDRAIRKENLMVLFNMTERELLAEIMKERLDGIPILAKKTDGGGFYLPADNEEIDGYLKVLKRGIDTQQNVYQSIKQFSESHKLSPIGSRNLNR